MTWGLARTGLRSPGSVAAAASYLLDQITAAPVVAFGMRRLRGAYVGPCIRVRRGTDNAEQDVGFSGADLDVAALLAFCGSGSGYVSKWYDQSGNALNFGQTTASNQPLVVSAGAVTRLSNVKAMPGMKLVGASSHSMSVPSITTSGPSRFSAYIVCSTTASSSGNSRVLTFKSASENVDYSSNASVVLAYYNGGSVRGERSGVGTYPVSVTASPFQLASVWADSGGQVVVDGNAGGNNGGLYPLATAGLLMFGTTPGTNGAEALDGMIAEQLFIPSVVSAGDMAAIRLSQKSYYGTP